MRWFAKLVEEREHAVYMNNALHLKPERFVINLDDYDRLIEIADYFSNLPKTTGNCSMCHVRLDQADINDGKHDESCPMSDEWVKP